MSTVFSRVRRAVSVLVAEDRPDFKRVDVSRVSYDDGLWLDSPAMQSTLVRRVYA
jgi:hypothetical protein